MSNDCILFLIFVIIYGKEREVLVRNLYEKKYVLEYKSGKVKIIGFIVNFNVLFLGVLFDGIL